MAVFVSHKQPI